MASGTKRSGWSDLIEDGPADFRQMLIDTTRADLRETFEALRAGDFERAGFIAHRMKGTARLLDADATIAACIALETQCRQRDAALAQIAWLQIEGGFESAITTLDASSGKPARQTRSFDPDT
jgi:HPt (histidine-containing phosphotransfer) domain-containing protein